MAHSNYIRRPKPASQAVPKRSRRRVIDENQWKDILSRAVKGESTINLAREYGIDESTLRARGIVEQKKKIREIAENISTAQDELKSLPVISRIVAIDFANELMAISIHLASAAKKGAITADALSTVAQNEALKIDPDDPEEGLQNLSMVAKYTSVANEAARLGTNLLQANKDRVQDTLDRRNVIDITPKLITDDAQDASDTYRRLIGGHQ